MLVGNYQLWVLIIGSLVPLASYAITKYGNFISEPVKAFIHVLVAAVAGGLYAAIALPNFGFNTHTLELVLSSVVAAFAAHHWLWKPSGVSEKVKASV